MRIKLLCNITTQKVPYELEKRSELKSSTEQRDLNHSILKNVVILRFRCAAVGTERLRSPTECKLCITDRCLVHCNGCGGSHPEAVATVSASTRLVHEFPFEASVKGSSGAYGRVGRSKQRSVGWAKLCA